eukprot:13095809-Ditylum_brightwellii.AAC.1
MEMQAALVKLLEERILHLGNGESTEKAHPHFRIFGTCTTTATPANSLSGGGGGNGKKKKKKLRGTVNNAGSGGRKVLHPSLWRKLHVDLLPYSELRDIEHKLYPSLPFVILDAALFTMRLLDEVVERKK